MHALWNKWLHFKGYTFASVFTSSMQIEHSLSFFFMSLHSINFDADLLDLADLAPHDGLDVGGEDGVRLELAHHCFVEVLHGLDVCVLRHSDAVRGAGELET